MPFLLDEWGRDFVRYGYSIIGSTAAGFNLLLSKIYIKFGVYL